MTIFLPKTAFDYVGRPYDPDRGNPQVMAQFCATYAAAAGIVRKDLFVGEFEEKVIRDPVIGDLARKTKVVVDETVKEPDGHHSREPGDQNKRRTDPFGQGSISQGPSQELSIPGGIPCKIQKMHRPFSIESLRREYFKNGGFNRWTGKGSDAGEIPKLLTSKKA